MKGPNFDRPRSSAEGPPASDRPGSARPSRGAPSRTIGVLILVAAVLVGLFVWFGISRELISPSEDELRSALRAQIGTSAERVELNVLGGTVELSGSVRNERERSLAVRALEQTPGVDHVDDDRLRVE
jgi:flagellar biosynthesis/type III secretory pathway M-ring protein FliF/YscJ